MMPYWCGACEPFLPNRYPEIGEYCQRMCTIVLPNLIVRRQPTEPPGHIVMVFKASLITRKLQLISSQDLMCFPGSWSWHAWGPEASKKLLRLCRQKYAECLLLCVQDQQRWQQCVQVCDPGRLRRGGSHQHCGDQCAGHHAWHSGGEVSWPSD